MRLVYLVLVDTPDGEEPLEIEVGRPLVCASEADAHRRKRFYILREDRVARVVEAELVEAAS